MIAAIATLIMALIVSLTVIICTAMTNSHNRRMKAMDHTHKLESQTHDLMIDRERHEKQIPGRR